jgi:hypothetical protein
VPFLEDIFGNLQAPSGGFLPWKAWSFHQKTMGDLGVTNMEYHQIIPSNNASDLGEMEN